MDEIGLPSEILLDELFELFELTESDKEVKREIKATIAARR
jgi:hypothetical protein